MPLLGNYSVLLKSPGRSLGGSTLSGDRANWNGAGASRNKFINPQWSQYSSVPIGYAPGQAWIWAEKPGVVSMSYVMRTDSVQTITLGTPATRSCSMSMSSVVSITPFMRGILGCAITPFTTLSPENLAVAVWNAQTSGLQAVGSFGELMVALGARLPASLSGGKITATLDSTERDAIANSLLDLANGVEASYTVKQTLRLMAAVLCGKASGGPGSTVFRNMPDTANRVATTADVDGNRSVVTLTP
jgi:hypothetical protein